jgi:hypothetical protein
MVAGRHPVVADDVARRLLRRPSLTRCHQPPSTRCGPAAGASGPWYIGRCLLTARRSGSGRTKVGCGIDVARTRLLATGFGAGCQCCIHSSRWSSTSAGRKTLSGPSLAATLSSTRAKDSPERTVSGMKDSLLLLQRLDVERFELDVACRRQQLHLRQVLGEQPAQVLEVTHRRRGADHELAAVGDVLRERMLSCIQRRTNAVCRRGARRAIRTSGSGAAGRRTAALAPGRPGT